MALLDAAPPFRQLQRLGPRLLGVGPFGVRVSRVYVETEVL